MPKPEMLAPFYFQITVMCHLSHYAKLHVTLERGSALL